MTQTTISPSSSGGEGFDTLLFELVWTSVNLVQYGFEQSALHLLDIASELWSERYEYYDIDENLTEILDLNDDGTSTSTVFDVANEYEWSRVDSPI